MPRDTTGSEHVTVNGPAFVHRVDFERLPGPPIEFEMAGVSTFKSLQTRLGDVDAFELCREPHPFPRDPTMDGVERLQSMKDVADRDDHDVDVTRWIERAEGERPSDVHAEKL